MTDRLADRAGADAEPAELNEQSGTEADDEGLALYIHWPFCVSKCPYCDFNSHVRESIDQDLWREALLKDLAHEASAIPNGELTSIFFGGGTPSLMPPATVAALIEAAEGHWRFDPEIEITLEANPSSVEASRFADLAAAGINRVSLGLQSLDDEALHFLGRAHDSTEGLMALGTAQSAFDRVSFDLIYALPGQRLDDWERALAEALSFGTDHLSLYQLTIEPGTRFAAMAARGELEPLDPDEAANFYEATEAMTGAAGLPAYEISNHARAGKESRHNLTYWRYRPYSGVGPGAHGRRTGQAMQRHRKPENWLSALTRNGHGIVEQADILPPDRGIEALVMGLRLSEGVDLERIARLADTVPAKLVDMRAVATLEQKGLLQLRGNRLRIEPKGRLLLDRILAEIVTVG